MIIGFFSNIKLVRARVYDFIPNIKFKNAKIVEFSFYLLKCSERSEFLQRFTARNSKGVSIILYLYLYKYALAN